MWQNLHLLLISWVILSWFRIKLKMYTTARGFQSRPNFQARGWPRTQETRSRVGWDRSASVLSATPWPPAGELCYFSSASPFSGSLRFLLSEADPALGPQTTLKIFPSRKMCMKFFLRISITAHLSNFNLLVLNTYICLPEARAAVLGGTRHLPQGSVLFSISFLWCFWIFMMK